MAVLKENDTMKSDDSLYFWDNNSVESLKRQRAKLNTAVTRILNEKTAILNEYRLKERKTGSWKWKRVALGRGTADIAQTMYLNPETTPPTSSRHADTHKGKARHV